MSSPKLHSAGMASIRSTSLIAAALVALAMLAGCGSDDEGELLTESDATSIDGKLEQVRERAASGRCTGDNSALSSLTSLSGFVTSDALNYVSAETRADLEELLARLGEQIQSQCEQVSDLTTTTTDSIETETTTADPDTTNEKTTSTSRETTDTSTRDTTTTPQPPNNGGNQGGGNQGGGNQGGGNQGGGNQGGGSTSPGGSDSGGIGPGVIGPIFRSGAPGGDPSVLAPGDDDHLADPGASR